MRNVSDKICRENQNPLFVFNNFFFPKIVYFCDNMGKYGTACQTPDGNMALRIACWVTKYTDTRSCYLILIAFPRQWWLCERAALLPYTALACFLAPPPPPPVTKRVTPQM
jgi:hypothetical protein